MAYLYVGLGLLFLLLLGWGSIFGPIEMIEDWYREKQEKQKKEEEIEVE